MRTSAQVLFDRLHGDLAGENQTIESALDEAKEIRAMLDAKIVQWEDDLAACGQLMRPHG